jgi:polar amino acid transport system substrate-binding protein
MHVVPTGTQADALRLVASGQADYAVVASLPAAYIIKKLNLTNVVPIAKSVISVKYCYGVKKGNAELLAKINEGLAILKQTGRYQAIYDKWVGVLEPMGIARARIFKYGSFILVVFLFILGGILLWSTTLRKQVATRTAALEREVQERKRAAEELRLRQQQLVQADKMASLGILVSGVAHEINNPNALIMLNAPLIMDYLKDTKPIVEAHYREHGDFDVAGLPYSRMRAKVPEKLVEIQDGAKKIKRIVDDLKGFARREESDTLMLLDLNTTVQTAIRLVENTIRKSTDHFEAAYAQDLPKIRGNAQRIEQVIVNLVLNACQALRSSNEKIAIYTSYDAARGDVIFEIRDEGEGICRDDLSHLTDPFFTTKRERGGTGLGLSVSAGIVKEHGGFLEFASVEGQGATATLRIPAASDELEETKA